MKILIFGLPGSGKTTLSAPLAELLGGVHINADYIRQSYGDFDMSLEGRKRQAMRMRFLADGVVLAGKVAVVDFVCPTESTRNVFRPDFTVWMDTVKEGRFDDTNKMFEAPTEYDYQVSQWFDNTHDELLKVIKKYMLRRHVNSLNFELSKKDIPL